MLLLLNLTTFQNVILDTSSAGNFLFLVVVFAITVHVVVVGVIVIVTIVIAIKNSECGIGYQQCLGRLWALFSFMLLCLLIVQSYHHCPDRATERHAQPGFDPGLTRLGAHPSSH